MKWFVSAAVSWVLVLSGAVLSGADLSGAPSLRAAEPQIGSATTHFRYMRPLRWEAPGQACAVLDPAIYTHAEGSLKDLRLYRNDSIEVPYVLTLSGTGETESEAARVRNLGQKGATIVFDLEMPPRAYTDVTLDLNAANFLATAEVSGATAMDEAAKTRLGSFAVFDLSSQRLARSTTLHLPESTFSLLHVALKPLPGSGALLPEMVRGALVPPSREAQTRYTPALQSDDPRQVGRETVVRFTVPSRVPIEQVRFTLAPDFKRNFSRTVRITSHAIGEPANTGEVLTGTIERLHLLRDGAEFDDMQLSVPATLGANLQTPAEVEVAIENGDDPPLPIETVTLAARERKLCFETPADSRAAMLFYGDAQLGPPRYDYARTFQPERNALSARLGPEQLNPRFAPRADTRSLTDRHPKLVYLALILTVCLLGLVALRSAKLRV